MGPLLLVGRTHRGGLGEDRVIKVVTAAVEALSDGVSSS